MSHEAPDGVDLWVAIPRIWAARWRVLLAMLAAGLLALLVVTPMPKWYRAEASILPPDDSDLFRNLTVGYQVLKKFPVFGVLGNYHTPADVYRGILHSRRVRTAIVERFDLQKVYRQRSREKTLELLGKRSKAILAPDGTITMRVDDRDPQRAAAMARAFLDELDRVNVGERSVRARRMGAVLEGRAREADSALRVVEEELARYQRSHHAVIPSVESSWLDAAADAMARKIGLEVRIGVQRSYLPEDSDELRATRRELLELERTVADLPEVQSDLERMVRDRRVREQVLLFLASEVEHAKMRQTMDTPTIRLLDLPKVPERHSHPTRLKAVLVTVTLAFFAACVWAARSPRAPETHSLRPAAMDAPGEARP